MKRHVSAKVNHLSMNLLISYLSILAVPLLAIIIIYFTASNLLMSVQKEKMYTTLNITALDVSRSMEEAGNLGIYVSNSAELKRLCGKIDQDEEYYDMYQYIRTLSDYSMFNEAIEGVYIFFNNGNYLVKNMVVMPADERGYQALGMLGKISLADLQKQFDGEYYNRQVLCEQVSEKISGSESSVGDEQKLVVLQTFSYNGYESPKGTIAVVIHDDLIKRCLEANLIKGEGMTLMLDHSNETLRIHKAIVGENSKVKPEDIPLEAIHNNKKGEILLGGEYFIVCEVEDPLYPFSYLSIVPRKTVLGQIGYIKYLIVLLCVCSILLGLAVCIGLWRKRRNVVLAFSRYHDEFGTVQEGGKSIRSFWEGVPYLLDSVVNLQSSLKLQKNFMRTAVVRRLLFGEYESGNEIEEDFKSADIRLEGKGYYAVVLALRGASFQEEAQQWNELRLYVKEYMQKRACIPNYYCELDSKRAAVVFPVSGEESLGIVRKTLKELQESLLEEVHLEAYIGIGRCVTERIEIATSYDDAKEVTDYLTFHDIRAVMEKSELPKQADSFFFPVESELHLVKVIKQGNQEELEDIFRVLIFENFSYRKLSPTMAGHLLELVRATAVRALKEEAQYYGEAINSLNKAGKLEEILSALKGVLPEIHRIQKQKEGQSADSLKKELKNLIEEHFMEPEYTLYQLAEAVNLSENKLYKQFKGLFGMSFSEYLENVRIKKACELLKKQMPVKDVAQAVGYGSDFSFRRAFKRVMGLAPSYYAEGLGEEV